MKTEAFQNPNLKQSENGNVEFDKEKYGQICIWQSTVLAKEQIDELQEMFKDQFDVEVLFLEQLLTKSDVDHNGNIISGTGNRSDVFLAVDTSSPKFGQFCIKRLQLGIRWIEDATSMTNGYHENPIYPQRVLDYATW